jgi:hypothetical protein
MLLGNAKFINEVMRLPQFRPMAWFLRFYVPQAAVGPFRSV